MPPEIVALLGKPSLLAVVLAVGVGVGVTIERWRSAMRRRAWQERKRRWTRQRKGSAGVNEWLSPSHPRGDRPDATDQLRIVMAADFTARPVLNKSEGRLFKTLDQIVIGCNSTWQVLAQVSLGEILRCRDAEAYGCVNSKRVDLLLMDDEMKPRHAIEYQGRAHHQGAAAARDAVKREALRRAGIGYHEVVAGHTTPAELRRLVERLVDRPKRVADLRAAEPTSSAPRSL